MTYDDMMTFVAAGKVAYLPVYPNVVILREGDMLIRRIYHSKMIDMPFIASRGEMNTKDWQIEDYSQDMDGIYDDFVYDPDTFSLQPMEIE